MRLRNLVCATLLGMVILTALPASAGGSDWLLRQADLEVARLTGELPSDTRQYQDDFSGGTANYKTSSGRSPAVPMLMSLILPGAGELYLGHKRGFLQIALDAASWYGAISNASKGSDKKDEYYAYADAHWFEPKLQAAYDTEWGPDRPYWNPDYDYMAGDGFDYFPDVTGGYTSLPLWVSKEADRREYYENLGKWDQFVFGWDDYTDPRIFLGVEEAEIANLKDPRTSQHREAYRDLRQESNDYYAKRDRFIYLSIAFRVFSVLQVAYLEGLLFGGGSSGDEPQQLRIGSHEVDFFVEPVGYTRGVIGATVSF